MRTMERKRKEDTEEEEDIIERAISKRRALCAYVTDTACMPLSVFLFRFYAYRTYIHPPTRTQNGKSLVPIVVVSDTVVCVLNFLLLSVHKIGGDTMSTFSVQTVQCKDRKLN